SWVSLCRLHGRGCSARSSSTSVFRHCSTRGLRVLIFILSVQGRVHDAASNASPRPDPSSSTSTTHARHTATGVRSSLWHRAGTTMPAARAASHTVVPSGPVTVCATIELLDVLIPRGAVADAGDDVEQFL